MAAMIQRSGVLSANDGCAPKAVIPANTSQMAGEDLVALCDVDHEYAAPIFKKYPGAKVWKDYREMLEAA